MTLEIVVSEMPLVTRQENLVLNSIQTNIRKKKKENQNTFLLFPMLLLKLLQNSFLYMAEDWVT